MNLREWIEQLPPRERTGERARIGAAVEVTEQAVRHWVNGTRNVPGTKCRGIAKSTGGAVSCQELRPDIFGAPKEGRAA